MPREAGEVDPHAVSQVNADHVSIGVPPKRIGFEQIPPALDNSLGQQKPGRQFLVVAGGSHGDRERPFFQLDFEGFLDCDGVQITGRPDATFPMYDPSPG
jgi:hypothetical protein